MAASLLAVGLGAAIGAILRWWLGLWLNALSPTVPLGTLVANVVGGYLIGVALAVLAQHPGLSPLWRLALVTGFLGGLTTFSTFSAEVMAHLMQGRLGAALALIGLHLAGSLAATALGFATVHAWRRAAGATMA